MSRNDQYAMATCLEPTGLFRRVLSRRGGAVFRRNRQAPPPRRPMFPPPPKRAYPRGFAVSGATPATSPPPVPSPRLRPQPPPNGGEASGRDYCRGRGRDGRRTHLAGESQAVGSLGEGGAGYGISVLVHIVLLLIMSAVDFFAAQRGRTRHDRDRSLRRCRRVSGCGHGCRSDSRHGGADQEPALGAGPALGPGFGHQPRRDHRHGYRRRRHEIRNALAGFHQGQLHRLDRTQRSPSPASGTRSLSKSNWTTTPNATRSAI